MPRRPLDIGTHGQIKRTEVSKGRYRASARYRDLDGTTRTIQAFGRSGADAETRLKRAIKDRTAPTGEDINRESKLTDVADLWLIEIAQDSRRTPQTVDQYRQDVQRTITPALGNLRIRECTTSRIDRTLKAIAKDHPAKARRIKVILTGILGMAVRHDALPANPVRDVAGIAGAKKDVRAIGPDELTALRERIRLWETGAATDNTPRHTGRPRTTGLLDIVDIMLATGVRIGEVLAVRWADIDLGATPPRLTISGTVVRLPGRQADGGGLVRQPHPKTASGHRTVLLPAFAVRTLMRMQVEAEPNAWDVIFPSATATLRDPHNVRRQWRDARGEAFAWVKPHTFRKTVATLVDRERGDVDAAAQLGHSGTSVTRRHYIEKALEAPDLTDVLNQLGG